MNSFLQQQEQKLDLLKLQPTLWWQHKEHNKSNIFVNNNTLLAVIILLTYNIHPAIFLVSIMKNEGLGGMRACLPL